MLRRLESSGCGPLPRRLKTHWAVIAYSNKEDIYSVLERSTSLAAHSKSFYETFIPGMPFSYCAAPFTLGLLV